MRAIGVGDELKEIMDRFKAMEKDLPDKRPDGLPYGCDKCDGYGNVIDETGARPCECKLRYFQKQNMRRLTLPAEFADMSFDNFVLQLREREAMLCAAQEYVERFRDDPSMWLYLFSTGSGGMGKTHLAVSALRRLMARGHTGAFLQYIGDSKTSMVSSTWHSLNTREQPFYFGDDYLDLDVVVIDDLGAGRNSVVDPIRESVSRFIRIRHERKKALVITSNLSMAGVAEQFQEHVVSRIEGRAIIVDCTKVKSYRKPKGVALKI